ncbi:MAG: site-specific integrase [Oscillibacter sp.]|nr:site-specific integrase [uncultured Oscillibacter sp.]MCI8812482.1 site-specific integrase [Oscillibacter sp.]
MTLSEWLDKWLENMADTLQPNTLRNYRSYIENHIRPALGDKQLARITPKDVQWFYEKLNNTLASCTVRRIHTTLHGALKAAKQAHLIANNPTEQIIAPRFSYGAKQVLTDEQLDVFMKVIAEDEVWCDFFYTKLTTGLRRGEICGLKWEDFDEANGTLKICRTVYRETGGELTAGDTKTSAGVRKIVLPVSTVQVLRKRKKSALTKWIFPNPLKPEQPTNPGSTYRQLKVLLKRAGLPNIRFHDLRQTFSVRALQNGVDVKTLSAMLGPYSAGFTLDTYAHVTTSMQKRAANAVGNFLSGTLQP